MLTGILPGSQARQDLFSKNLCTTSEHRLMQKMNKNNTKYGSGTPHYASTGVENSGQMKQERLSTRYTTKWDELVKIQAYQISKLTIE